MTTFALHVSELERGPGVFYAHTHTHRHTPLAVCVCVCVCVCLQAFVCTPSVLIKSSVVLQPPTRNLLTPNPVFWLRAGTETRQGHGSSNAKCYRHRVSIASIKRGLSPPLGTNPRPSLNRWASRRELYLANGTRSCKYVSRLDFRSSKSQMRGKREEYVSFIV